MIHFEVYKIGKDKESLMTFEIKKGQKVSEIPSKQMVFDLLKGKKGKYLIKEILIIN